MTDITMQIKLQPFFVPKHVFPVLKPGTRQDGFKPAPHIELCDLDEQTLSSLCDDYRKSIFAIAKKVDPHARHQNFPNDLLTAR